MRSHRLLGLYSCGVISLFGFVWTTLTHKECNEPYKSTYIRQYVGQVSCPYYEEVCNGWFFSRRCTNYLRYTYCTRLMTRTEYFYQNLPVCCPGYVELTNGTCLRDCAVGKFGNECQYDCSCRGQAYPECDIDTGSCTCLPGWTGNDCNEVCLSGWFGSNCSSECPCRNNATCSPQDGVCNCTSAGWTGPFCQEECSSTKFGINCHENCTCKINETCNRFDGSCTCIKGKTGVNCSEDCPAYKFGADCIENCSCVHSTGCDAISGKCFCDVGYTGQKCEEVCTSGTFGAGCNQTCNCTGAEVCDPETGQCFSRCVCHEQGTANCHPLYNPCRCSPYHNHTCHDENLGLQERCRDVCECSAPDDTCCVSNSSVCDCKDGWTGRKCSIMCPAGTYGRKCYGVCNCSADESCHHVTGECLPRNKYVPARRIFPEIGAIFWTISGVLLSLVVALTGLGVFLLKRRFDRRVASSHPSVKPASCYNCFKPQEEQSSLTQRYSELQEDLNSGDTCDNYDHLDRPNQANSQRKITFDPTYSRTRDLYSEYSSTLPSKMAIVEDEYSHIKGIVGGSEENETYDHLQSRRMVYPDKEDQLQQIPNESPS